MKIFWWSLKDEVRWLLLWAIVNAVIICFVVWLYPSFGDMMETFIGKTGLLRMLMGRFAPDIAGQSMLNLWLSLEFFAQFAMLTGFYALFYASNTVAAELERQTMDLLLAQPVSRWRVLLEKFGVIVLNLAVLFLLGFVVLVTSIDSWLAETVTVRLYVSIFVNKYFLVVMIAAFGFFCSVLVGNQRGALTLGVVALMFAFILYRALTLANVAMWLARLMPFYYADATKVLSRGRMDWGDNLVLGVAGVVFLVAALVAFRLKDITK